MAILFMVIISYSKLYYDYWWSFYYKLLLDIILIYNILDVCPSGRPLWG